MAFWVTDSSPDIREYVTGKSFINASNSVIYTIRVFIISVLLRLQNLISLTGNHYQWKPHRSPFTGSIFFHEISVLILLSVPQDDWIRHVKHWLLQVFRVIVCYRQSLINYETSESRGCSALLIPKCHLPSLSDTNLTWVLIFVL